MQTVDLLCLANSRKHGNRCVAGLRMDGGGWVRPVSKLVDGALMPNRIALDDGTAPRMLDVIRIPIGPPAPKPHQPEDLTLEPGPWRLLQRPCEWDTMVKLIRKLLIREPMLLGNDSDRVARPEPEDPPLPASLAAVTAVDLEWHIGQSRRGNRQTRAIFTLATQS